MTQSTVNPNTRIETTSSNSNTMVSNKADEEKKKSGSYGKDIVSLAIEKAGL